MTPAGSREKAEQELRDFARLQVRSGLLDPQRQHDELVSAVRAELPGTDEVVLARAWLVAAARQLDALSRTWPDVTDHDRLQAAFAECEEHDVPVLQGVADHRSVGRALQEREGTHRGVLWFTPPDVWHAIDHGLLRVTLSRPDTTPVDPQEPLATAVVGCLQRHGLQATFSGEHVEVAASWQRRPPSGR